ncbi:MAG: alcohol dehydrogenase [Deltaproteobacteria bacterium]|nr:alcohol dehydrogenase [Deltaproteobacteria bacterium]
MQLPKTYRKLVVTKPGPDIESAAEIVAVPLPTPAADEILLRNRYAGVNASDPVAASGGYGARTVPFDLGVESAGEVVAVGSAVEHLKVGDHALAFSFGGGYGEYRVVKAQEAFAIPEATPEITSAFVAGMTAIIGLEVAGEMQRDETVLVTAAAGGVGTYAVQLAKLAGNHVIGTCSDDAKARWLKELGCDRAINYRTEDLDAVLASEYPRGINLVFESVGRATFDTALKHLAVFGRLVCIGAVSEYGAGLNWERVEQVRIYQWLLARSASVRGCYLPHYAAQIPPYMTKLVALLREGKIHAAIDATEFRGIDAVKAAIAHLAHGRNQGKVLLRF